MRVVGWLGEGELCGWMREAKTRVEHERRLAVWMGVNGYGAEEIGRMLGVSGPTVWRWVGKYNREGPGGLIRAGWGGRRRGYLTVEGERALVAELTAAAGGKRVAAKEMQSQVSAAVGREVSMSYVYAILRRHGGAVRG